MCGWVTDARLDYVITCSISGGDNSNLLSDLASQLIWDSIWSRYSPGSKYRPGDLIWYDRESAQNIVIILTVIRFRKNAVQGFSKFDVSKDSNSEHALLRLRAGKVLHQNEDPKSLSFHTPYLFHLVIWIEMGDRWSMSLLAQAFVRLWELLGFCELTTVAVAS